MGNGAEVIDTVGCEETDVEKLMAEDELLVVATVVVWRGDDVVEELAGVLLEIEDVVLGDEDVVGIVEEVGTGSEV